MRSTRALVALAAAAVAAPTATAGATEPEPPATPDVAPVTTPDLAPAAVTPFTGEATVVRQMRRHAREQARRRAHRRLVDRYERAARRSDERPRPNAKRWSDRRLRDEIRDLRRARRAANAGPTGHLAAIAQCESGGNPRAISPGGTYRGMYQFSMQTWQAVGGKGDPAAASVAEQTKRAKILYAKAGPGQWPVCGR